MTVSRVKCPASDLWGDRHMVTDRRWALVAPDGEEIMLPADVEASRREGEVA